MSNQLSNSVRRAKNGFKSAFISLIKEIGYSKITVTDIVERADYNRSSFYKYFTDKEAITEEVINEIVEGYTEACRKTYTSNQNVYYIKNTKQHSNGIFEYIYNNSIYFDLLAVDDTIPGLASRIIETIKLILKEEVSIFTDEKVEYNSEYIINFRAYGVYGAMLQWIKSNYLHTPAELAEELTILFNGSFTLIRGRK